jgi:hypothetical protein
MRRFISGITICPFTKVFLLWWSYLEHIRYHLLERQGGFSIGALGVSDFLPNLYGLGRPPLLFVLVLSPESSVQGAVLDGLGNVLGFD